MRIAANANSGKAGKRYNIRENIRKLFFPNNKRFNQLEKTNIEAESFKPAESESVAVTKTHLRRGASLYIALLGMLVIMVGILFFKLDKRDAVTVDQNDPAPKFDTARADTEKEPSLASRNLSFIKSDTEKPPSLSLPDDFLVIYFNHNSFEISDASLEILGRLAKSITNREDRRLLITGYSDSTGPKAYNNAISQRRADTVKDYLVNKGVALSKITAVGLGAQDFVASNETENGRRLNRRVEIELK